MAKSIAQIRRELTLYQCCIADLAAKIVVKELLGHQDTGCLYRKLQYMVTLHEALSCPQAVLTREYLTQAELEDELEKLNDLCNCIICEDPDEITDDTINAILSSIVPDQSAIECTNCRLLEDGSYLLLEDGSNRLLE